MLGTALSRPAVPMFCLRALRCYSIFPTTFPSENSTQLSFLRRLLPRQTKLPKLKTLAEYQFDFPKKIQKQKVIRLFDCEFIEQHRSAVLVEPAGVGKTHLLTAPGYTACKRGITVRFTRVIEMIDRLMHHGDAIAIQGNSFRMKGGNADA
jgi:DNA replication protein DnaC